MKTWVRRSLNAGALTAGALLATGAAAHADPALVSSDNIGILNGTQVLLPVQAPIDICGNAVGVIGSAAAGCEGGSAATLNPEWGFGHFQAVSAGNVGIGNGTQIIAPTQAPIDICGNAVGVIGSAYAGCEGGADATIGHGSKGHGSHGHRGYPGHGSNCGCPTESALTESLVPTEGLVDGLPAVGNLLGGLTGNSTGLPLVGDLLGGLVSGAPTAAVSDVLAATPAAAILPHSESTVLESESSGPIYGGHGGGTVKPRPMPLPKPQQQPCGCQDGHGHGGHGHGGHGSGPVLTSTGNVGILNGTQVYAPIQIPIDVSGNAVSVLGTATAWSQGGATATQR